MKTGSSYCFKKSKGIVLALLLSFSFAFRAGSQVIVFATETIIPEAALLLSKYVQFESVTGNERAAGEYISDLCRQRGLHVELFTDSVDSYNFAASLYPLDLQKPNVILLSHLDVVGGGTDSLWNYHPFSGTIAGDTVWGRGTIDMKGTGIMQLLAVSSYAEKASEEDLSFNITLLFVSSEEAYGIKGAKIISDRFMPALNAAVILGEGGIGTTGLLLKSIERPVFFISTNEKRALWLELDLHYNSSGHGAVPPPEYATRIMINSLHGIVNSDSRIKYTSDNIAMLKGLGELEPGLTGFILRHPVLFKPILAGRLKKNPLMSSVFTNTITITHISSEETVINQIPQNARAYLDCRLLPETSTETFIEYVSGILDNDMVTVNIVSETRKAPSTMPDRFFDILAESLDETYPGCGIVPVLFPATTDNNYFRNKGVPVYGVVPVLLNQKLLETVHTYNERLPFESLLKGTEVYRRFIGKLLSAGKHENDSLMLSNR